MYDRETLDLERLFAEVTNMSNMFHEVNAATTALDFSKINNATTMATMTLPLAYMKKLMIKPEKAEWIEGLPAIEKVETYNDRATKVTFVDGTFTKAVCSDNDHFDLDVGITICAMKRMLGKDGNRHYNNFIRHAHEVIVKNDKAKEKEAREKAEARMRKRKFELKRAAKKLKAKEEQIDIQKQAILRALDEREKSCMVKEDDLK